MSNARDTALAAAQRGQRDLLRREEALAQDVLQAYEQARQALMTEFMDRAARLGSDPTPGQIRTLANDLGLIRAIEARMMALELELTNLLRRGLTPISQEAFALAAAEIEALALALDVMVFQFALDPLLELTIGPALAHVPGLIAAQRATITAAMRESLSAGDRVRDIAQSLFGKSAGIFRNGMTSAELMTRRAVIQANNNSKSLYYEQAQRQYLPTLQKQIVATIGPRTTQTCLRAHGQIKPLDEPFDISGEPSFGRRQMHPPFHWNCRTTVAPYLAQLETTSTLKTSDMRQAAQQELQRRIATP